MVKKEYYILIGILLVAAILRLWGLSRGDATNDEIFYAFRAIKMIDFDHAEFQTTPWEWWDPNIPSWTKLSFHDHPPFVFWAQHLFIKFFGETNFAFRLPSALVGLGSIYILYLLGRLLFSPLVGLLSAGILAVGVNHVALSRTGLQEPYVVFFMLLTSLFFFRVALRRKENYFIASGIALGLGLLVKYNVFILVPIFLTYLLFYKREYLLNKKLWGGAILAIIIFSPIVFYNYKLYRAVGHFDFQFSYIFGQHPAVWKVAPGKDIGSVGHRLKDFVPRLVDTNSWVFLSLFAAALASFLILIFKNSLETIRRYGVLVIALFWLGLLLILVGPVFRFLTMLTPFMALGAAIFLSAVYKRWPRRATLSLLLLLAVFEIFYSYNSQIAYFPKGPRILAWSPVRFENYNWGYNDLARFLSSELKGKMPAFVLDMKYKFLERLRDEAVAEDVAHGLEPYPAMIVHYGNFDDAAKLWVLDRLMTYHAWPVISFNDYVRFIKENGPDYFKKSGFRYYYFIWQTNIEPSKEFLAVTAGIAPIVIVNKRGDRAFQVYKIILPQHEKRFPS